MLWRDELVAVGVCRVFRCCLGLSDVYWCMKSSLGPTQAGDSCDCLEDGQRCEWDSNSVAQHVIRAVVCHLVW